MIQSILKHALLFVFTLATSYLSAADGGVILLYHHVSDSTPAITSVSPSQFEEHLNYLEEQEFNVVSLSTMLDAISERESLPDRAIAISFDDAYESVYSTAYPLLKLRGWPFSVFVSSDATDRGYGGFMSWQQLREVSEYGAEIGGHSASHAHLIRTLSNETHDEWLSRVSFEMDQGTQRIEEELGKAVRFFAYPYGEFNSDLKLLLAERGLFGLAQHSGAIGPYTDLLEVPRYPMAQGFANMERFALVTKTKALPIAEIDSGPLVRIAGQESGYLYFELKSGDYQANNLACYSSSGARLETDMLERRVSVALPIFSPGRSKINCTVPSNIETGIYYWFSRQWVVKTHDGDWPEE